MISVFDGHNDVLLRLHRAGAGVEPFLDGGEADAHVDLPRARSGGFGGGLFAVFVPAEDAHEPPEGATSYALPLSPPVDPAVAHATADAIADLLPRLETIGALRVVRSGPDLVACLADGTIGAVLHFEGAEAIAAPEDLERRYEHGLRSLGLVWSRANAYGEGVPFRFPGSPDTGPGLTPAGRELVHACNRLGVLVDLSHLNLRGFFDVASLSDAPLVASHSNAHALCASTRNLMDEQLDAIGDSGGIVGINFAVGFLREDGLLDTSTPLDVVVEHVDYIIERIGVDHVGFGSDFDGAKIPDGIGDAAGLPAVLDALRARGYDDEAITKVAHANWLRVLRRTWGS
jgi:membrane dipeptidase